MNSAKSLRSGALLMLTAAIWGAAFVAQSAGMEFIGPFTFNGLRTLIGAVVLIPVAWAVHRAHGAPIPWKRTLAGGAVCGLVFFAAVNLQQIGIQYTTAGKAGFITAMYVVLVPIVGLALGKRPGVLVWAGVVLACAGMYLLCMTDGLSLGRGDALILASAFGFTAHILVIDRFAADVDGRQGEVTDYYDSEANPLLGVTIDGREYLVPAVEEFIAGIDFEGRRLRMTLPEGLLSLND